MQAVVHTETKERAREKFQQYREAMKRSADQNDELLMKAYREIAAGRQVLDLVPTLKAAGVDPQGRPRLAIVRASAKECWFSLSTWADFSPRFGDSRNAVGHYKPLKRHSLWLPKGTFPLPKQTVTCKALVPSIPPQFRPVHRLENYHILWEAEWENMPPIDPLLLRHLGRGLYAVLAQWDLTPLERAVLFGSNT